MTNLIEKILLIGFGIFTLTIFSTILVPFLGTIAEFNENDNNDLNSYILFIDQFDQGINYVLQNPNDIYLKSIEYPNNLNITINNFYVKYKFLIDDKICIKILEYSKRFLDCIFHGIPPKIYLLNISYSSSLIRIKLYNLY